MKLSLMTLHLFICPYYQYLQQRDLPMLKSSYEELLNLAVEAGYHAVDVTSREVETMGLEYVRSALQCRKLSVSSYMAWGDFASQIEGRSAIESGRHAADAAKELESPVLMLIPQLGQGQKNERDAIHHALTVNLNPIVEYANRLGMMAAVENTPDLRLYLCHQKDVKAILDALPMLGLVYDSGNMLLVNEEPASYYRAFAGRIVHFHLKDMRIACSQDRKPDEGLNGIRMVCAATGRGMVNFKELLRTSITAGYQGYYSVEYAKVPEKSDLDSLRDARVYFETMVEKIR